jgi:hypothetical protein
MQYSIELCHTAGSDEELSNHDAKTQTHWLLVKTNVLEPHRMVRLTSLVDRTLFVAHLMQPTNSALSALVCRIFHICALVIYMCPGRRRAWSASFRKAAAAAATFHGLLDTFLSCVSVAVAAMMV